MSKMNANVLPMPKVQSSAIKKGRIREWLFNRAVDLGYIEMSDSQPKPAGYNATMILCTLLIVITMVGLVYVAHQQGYKQAEQDIKTRDLEKRVEQSEADSRKAKEMQIYNNGAKEEGNKEKK